VTATLALTRHPKQDFFPAEIFDAPHGNGQAVMELGITMFVAAL
jgi:hypothetical protein